VGIVINSRTLSAKQLLRLTPPIILCVGRLDFEKEIADSGYRTTNLNLPLSRLLAGYSLREIQSALTDKVWDVLPQSEPVYLADYEMLFDPRYELDVLRLFIEIARRNKLIAKWCGTLGGDALIYAEAGYADFKRYNISDYDVVIVK